MNRYNYSDPLFQIPASGQVWRRANVEPGTHSDMQLIEKDGDRWNVRYIHPAIKQPLDNLSERLIMSYFKRVI